MWLPHDLFADLQTGISIEFDGQTRTYELYVPGGSSSNPRPLILDMHGFSIQAEDQRRISGFRQLADSQNFIVAWPQGLASQWNATFGEEGTDDVGALRAIVAHISGNHSIDKKRIYAAGWSMGGQMAYRLACDAGDLVAAVGSAATPVRQGSEPGCKPVRPVPVIAFRGRDDGIVPYFGGFGSLLIWPTLSAAEMHEFWKTTNACQGNDQNIMLDSASCLRNAQCGGGAEVLSCDVEGGGFPENHNVYESPDADIAMETWKFFQTFTLPEIEESFRINAGLNDAWYDVQNPGQGFLITVLEDTGIVFLAWFTYDVTRPPEDVTAILGEPGHRWLTAQGPFAGNTASMTLFVTEGGIFDSPEPEPFTDGAGDGTLTIEFTGCNQATVRYQITSLGISGEIPIQRIATDNVVLCEALSAP